jgi:glycosyltransferase involved in cell wall biosynthesis
LNGASLVIGSVCALRPEKRMDLLLQAFAQVRRRQPGMKSLIVGSGPMRPELEALRRDLGLEQDCILEPAKVDVADWMRAMDIFVLSSSSESFPNALLEAMACGCCVIGSDVGGVGEMIEHQRSGLVFQSGDVAGLAESLLQAIDQKSWREQMGQAAARRARERFSMEIAVGTMQTIYDSVLQVTCSK